MQKRKFDELISHFNRKVSDMSIDQKYKMELLGMISAIGFAHEEELGTNLASLGTDCISREQAIDALRYAQHRFTVADEAGGMGTVKWSEYVIYFAAAERVLSDLPSAQPEIIRCKDCQYWNKGSCEYPEHVVNSQDYYVGDIETEAEYFCGYAERREVNHESN